MLQHRVCITRKTHEVHFALGAGHPQLEKTEPHLELQAFLDGKPPSSWTRTVLTTAVTFFNETIQYIRTIMADRLVRFDGTDDPIVRRSYLRG